MKGNKIFLYSLGSLVVLASSAVYAQEDAQAPSLEGGWSAMIGGMLFVPSVNDQAFAVNNNINGFFDFDEDYTNTTVNNSADYDTGWQAAIGYVFDETANGIELSYRGFDGSSDASQGGYEVDFDSDIIDFFAESEEGTSSNQNNRYENWDLMVSQFLDIGTHVQMRFLGGLSYLSNLEQTSKLNTHIDFASFQFLPNLGDEGFVSIEAADVDIAQEISSSYSGLGPRVGMDARYDFGEMLEGFGIVGGASLAYFLGELENKNGIAIRADFIEVCNGLDGKQDCDQFFDSEFSINGEDENDNHAVTNLRANLGIDYVYYFEDQDLPTLGLELGYEVDTYFDGIGTVTTFGGETDVTNITFSGPYLNLKGVF